MLQASKRNYKTFTKRPKQMALELLGDCGMISRSLKKSPAPAFEPHLGSAEFLRWAGCCPRIQLLSQLNRVAPDGGFRVPRCGISAVSFLNLLLESRV